MLPTVRLCMKLVIETKITCQSQSVGWFSLWFFFNRLDDTYCSFLLTSLSYSHCSSCVYIYIYILVLNSNLIYVAMQLSVRTVLSDFCCGKWLNSWTPVMKVKTIERCCKRETPLWYAPSLSTIEMWLVLDMQLIIQSVASRWVQVSKDPFDEPLFFGFVFFLCPLTSIFLIVWQNSPSVSHC